MTKSLTVGIAFAFCAGVVIAQDSGYQTVQTYGDIRVSKVLRLDEHVRIHCDLADYPAVIGQNIPVCINGLKPANDAKDNLKLLMFLNDLLLSKNSEPKTILLKGIQRGEQFCLVADVKIDGQDLCELLIEEKLAQKIVEVPQSKKTNSASSSAINESGYIASKSSKVYHRSSCLHAKRMDAAKAATFSSQKDAEKTGRRACKTCKP